MSEDENNAANILDQGERINATSSENMDFIDPKNIKTELDIEAQQMAGGLDYKRELMERKIERERVHTGQMSFSLSKCIFSLVCLNSVSILICIVLLLLFRMRIEEQCGEEDDSQQAAEAMVQLSGVGFYAQQQQGSYYSHPHSSLATSLPAIPFQYVSHTLFLQLTLFVVEEI